MKTLVLAISGGVDSMVMIDMMVRQNQDSHLVVAHVDHGIRPDGDKDESLVRFIAERHGLEFYSTKLHLGSFASEDKARQKRLEWLAHIKNRVNASAVVMAHHQDDVIETILMNLLRGTGWRGLVSLRSHSELHRPLLNKSKAELVQYAIDNHLEWREDSTNDDHRYLRNYIRLVLVPRLKPEQRKSLVSLYEAQLKLLPSIESEASQLMLSGSRGEALSRYFLTMIPEKACDEIIRCWLGRSLTTAQYGRLRHFIATAKPNSIIEIESGLSLQATITQLVVYPSSIR